MTDWKLLWESVSWILGGWKGGVTFGWDLASLVKILENVSETAASWIDQSSSSSQVSSVSAFYVFVLIWRNPRQGWRNYDPYRQTKVDLAWWISCWLWDLTCKYAIPYRYIFGKTKNNKVERRGGKLKSWWEISEETPTWVEYSVWQVWLVVSPLPPALQAVPCVPAARTPRPPGSCTASCSWSPSSSPASCSPPGYRTSWPRFPSVKNLLHWSQDC